MAWRLLRGSPGVLSYPYCHQMITQTHPRGNRRVSENVEFWKKFQVPRNYQHNSNFGAFGGAHGPDYMAWRSLCGSPWVLKYPYCHQMITQTHPRAKEGFPKMSNFRKFSCATKLPTQQQLRPFWGGMARDTWAYQPLRASPWVFKYPHGHQMITQTQPGLMEGFQKKPSFRKFSGEAC